MSSSNSVFKNAGRLPKIDEILRRRLIGERFDLKLIVHYELHRSGATRVGPFGVIQG